MSSEKTIKIRLNGKEQLLPEGITLRELIESKKMRPEVVTVEVNEEIIQNHEYPDTRLKEWDVVEFVFHMGGGAEVARCQTS